MKREAIILGGLFLLALNTIVKVYDVAYTDHAFWFVLVPIAFVGGLFIRNLCKP